MSDDEDVQYNHTNRAFLQALLSRSTLTFEEAQPILAAIFTAHGPSPSTLLSTTKLTPFTEGRETLPGDVTLEDFQSYISAANSAISPFDLEIRSTTHQLSRTRTYALVNTTSDPITQLATTHSPDEIAFLKRLLDAMFETHNTRRAEVMAITSTQAIQLHKAPEGTRRETQNGGATQGSGGLGLTMVQAEKVLKGLVDEGWLERSSKGFYTLSVRGLMELRGWLVETYNDVEDEEDGDAGRPVPRVKSCFACKEIVTMVRQALSTSPSISGVYMRS